MCRLGHSTVRFKAKDNKRSFSVHENLICSQSKLFKEKLQPRRKPVEGKCAVCQENLNPHIGDITFCRAACGQNIHEERIERWIRTRATCPQCQEQWQPKSNEPIVLKEALDNDALQLYLDWLYTNRLLIRTGMYRLRGRFSLDLLKAWTVSDVVQDDAFRHALSAEMISRGDLDKLNTDAIKYAFEQCPSSTMQAFIIDAVLTKSTPRTLKSKLIAFPPSFTEAVCDLLLNSVKEEASCPELLKKHTGGKYEGVTLDSDYSDSDY